MHLIWAAFGHSGVVYPCLIFTFKKRLFKIRNMYSILRNLSTRSGIRSWMSFMDTPLHKREPVLFKNIVKGVSNESETSVFDHDAADVLTF